MLYRFNSLTPEEKEIVIKNYFSNNPNSDVPKEELRVFFESINIEVLISKYISDYEVFKSLTSYKEHYERLN